MKIRLFLILVTAAFSGLAVHAAQFETLTGHIEVPDFEDYVDAGARARQEAEAEMEGSARVLLMQIKPAEAQHPGSSSGMISLSEYRTTNTIEVSDFRLAAQEMYGELQQAVRTGLPGIAIGNLILTDDVFLIPADMPQTGVGKLQSVMRSITGGLRIGGRVFPISANIESRDSAERELFLLKIRTWAEYICARNARHELPIKPSQVVDHAVRTKNLYGSFILPAHFEARGGQYRELADSAMQAASIPKPTYVLQQRGLNDVTREALANYARMMQSEIELDLSTYLAIPVGDTVVLDGDENPIAFVINKGLGTSRLLQVETSEMCYLGGRKSIKVVLTRQLGQNAPVRVLTFLTPRGKRTVQTVFSYRISDAIDWAAEIETIVNSFEFTE